ncbi:hypothetical protein ES706_04428 [subsurface metagenome]
MERIASSITIGIRELFRILVPGLMVVGYMRAEFPFLLSPWDGTASIVYVLILSFFIGLVVYVLRMHRWCWPWRNVFRQHIGRLIREVKVALGGMPPLMAEVYHAEYKHFLETRVDRYFTERVHYFTSFYYLLVEISQLFALFAVIEFGLVSYLLVEISQQSALFPIIEFGLVTPALLHLVGAFICIGGAILFHKFAKLQLEQITNEQIIMVKSNRGEFESMQRSWKLEDVTNSLKSVCDTMLKEMILDPDKRDYEIECHKHSAKDWGTGRDTDLYVVKVYTAYPLTIGGDPGGYKGFYKERLEAVLNHIVSLYQEGDRGAKVIVEVVPTEVRHDTLESLVPIDKAYKGILAQGSPVDELVRKLDIPHVLVRGRHLVGPNPGLLLVVEKVCQEGMPKSALDLFAGTGVVSKFLHAQGVRSITCVDNGHHFDISKELLGELSGITCVKEDAFRFRICQGFDLIVADPYYEDALNFLNARGNEILANTRIFVFVCGGVEHEHQRGQCKELIQSYLVVKPEEHLAYGQSILVCRKSS